MCIRDSSSIEESNIPKHDKEIKEKTNNTPTTLPTNQSLPSTDPRRKTIHGSEYTTADELMQKVSQDEQRRKASYNMLRTVGGSGMDTLSHSGSGVTRVNKIYRV